jgi:hypothetical protein
MLRPASVAYGTSASRAVLIVAARRGRRSFTNEHLAHAARWRTDAVDELA